MPEIDFIIAWVDGNDPEWQRRKAACLGQALGDDRSQHHGDLHAHLRLLLRRKGVQNAVHSLGRAGGVQ